MKQRHALGWLIVSLMTGAQMVFAVPIILPGAPGQGVQELSAEAAIDIANTSYSPDDVSFMQDMIPHHQQAVLMAEMAETRTNSEKVLEIAGRIMTSQADEIKFMAGWLSDRGERVPQPDDAHAMHVSHDMAGMASKEELNQLRTSEGVAFDRLFMKLMIAHHEGALEMVEHLLEQPGAAYDPVLYEFVNDVEKDQSAEIDQMNKMLVALSTDPRANLKAGFEDAGQAILNMTLIAALPKPAGFFDPQNPAGLPLPKPKKEAQATSEADANVALTQSSEAAEKAVDESAAHHHSEPGSGDEIGLLSESQDAQAADRAVEKDEQSNDKNEWSDRSPLLSFSNTDMAFRDDVLVVGSYHGFNVYQLATDGLPQLLSSVVCPGGQGDVSIVGHLLIMSVEQTRGRVDCGLQGIGVDVSPERFRGIRIFDISDLERPVQVGQVQTCRGSHTHSVVSGPGSDGKIIVYNSGTSRVRDNEEMASCYGEEPGDNRTALFRIDVIEIPVDDPSKAKIIDSPAVFADLETGRLAGLWQGGDHGDGTQETSETDQCHDITVFPEANIAAGACSGNGIIFDISDPRKPERIDVVTDKGFAYWHSATFNNEGTKVLFTDEWGGGSRPRCRSYDPLDWGADAIYDIVDGKLTFRSHFKIPAPQMEEENCVAHNGSVVPVPGRDIFVQAWYQGGLSVIDFTDSSQPFEIAYFDRGPIHEDHLVLGGYWSTYWYNGQIYGTEIARGLDVFELMPSEFITANEIAAARLANQGGTFNPQQQMRITWPAHPSVALAYLDQLDRDQAFTPDLGEKVRSALGTCGDRLAANKKDRSLARQLTRLSESLVAHAETSALESKVRALGDQLTLLADRLR